MKRARPQDIFEEMAPKAGTSSDNLAFQRALHRDLKSLQESYVIGVDYFTASGEKIPPGEEDSHTNFRLEYFVLDQLNEGGESEKFYLKLGGDAIIPPLLNGVLNFEKDFAKIPKGADVFSVELLPGSFFHVWWNVLDRPLTLHIGRKSTATSDVAYKKEVLEAMSQRSLVLLFLNPSVSRFKPETASGHCELVFTREAGQLEVTDRGSTFGTFLGEFRAEDLSEAFTRDTDQTHADSPFHNVDWEQLERPHLVEGPRVVKVGDIPIAVYTKS